MNDMLYIGFSSNFQDLTAANPSVHINFYHNETGKWYLTASETFTNNEEKVIHLTGMIVQGTAATKHHKRAVKSQWDYVKFKAQITKMDDKVKYQVNFFVHYCTFHKHANSKVQKLPSQLHFSLPSIIITITSNEP